MAFLNRYTSLPGFFWARKHPLSQRTLHKYSELFCRPTVELMVVMESTYIPPSPSLESPSLLFRVSVLDSNSRRPLNSASVQVFGNRKLLVSGLTSEAGVASVHLPPRRESNIVVRATSRGYVHASMLWRPRKLPRKPSADIITNTLRCHIVFSFLFSP